MRSTNGRLALAGAALLSAGWAALLTLRPIVEPDLFWHLAVGRFIGEHHRLPMRNLWSYTAPDHPFLASSWLYDVMLYGVHRLGGVTAVHLCTAALVGFTFAVVFLAVRARGASIPWALSTVLALAVGSEARFSPRPQVLSYVLLALLSLLLTRSAGRRSWRTLLACWLILAFWANLHAGVVFGLGLVGFHLVGDVLQSFPGRPWPARGRALLGVAATGLVFLAALLVNPGGPELIRYALFHVSDVDDVVKLAEFVIPPLQERPLFWAVLVVLPLLLLARIRETRVAEWLAWAAFGALACRAIRLIPDFFIVVAPSLGWAAQRTVERWLPPSSPRRARLAAVASGVLPLFALATVPFPTQHLVRRLGLGLDPFTNAERAVATASQWRLSGRVFAGWDVTGLVEWGLPEARVQIDPRLLAYPPSVFHEAEAAESSQEAFDAYLDRWDVHWALRSQQRYRFTGAGWFDARRWAVVFWDEGGQILVRRDDPRFEQLVREQEYVEFLPATRVFESWRSLRGERRSRWVSEAARLARSPLLVDAHAALCLEGARQGRLSSARDECRTAGDAADRRYWLHPAPDRLRSTSAALAHVVLAGELARRPDGDSPDPLLDRAATLAPSNADVWAGIGAVRLDMKRAELAAAAFRQALKLSPEHRPAADGLARAEALASDPGGRGSR